MDTISFDYFIKYILKHKADYGIVENFLTALLSSQEEKVRTIKIIAILDSESHKESEEKKRSIADLLVESDTGEQFIIEIERGYDNTIMHKAVFNTSRTIIDHVSSGGGKLDYLSVKKVYHITLLFFQIPQNDGKMYHGKIILRDTATKRALTFTTKLGKLIIDSVNIFPEFFVVCIPNFDGDIHKDLDEWLYMMKNEKILPTFKAPGIRQAFERMDYLKLTANERMDYDIHLKKIADSNAKIDSAREEGIEKGIAKGIEKGIAKGREEGREEGIEIGEKKREIAIAKNLLSQNVSLEVIVQATGLTIDQIKKF